MSNLQNNSENTYTKEGIVDFASSRKSINSLEFVFPLWNSLLGDFNDDSRSRHFSLGLNGLQSGDMTNEFVVGIINFLKLNRISTLSKIIKILKDCLNFSTQYLPCQDESLMLVF